MPQSGSLIQPGSNAALWVLRIAIAGQCVAMASIWLGSYSPINTLLLVDWGWPESTAVRVDQVAAWCFIIAAIVIAVRPTAWVLLPVAIWTLLIAWAVRHTNLDHPYKPLAPLSQAVRWVCPLVLALWIAIPHERRWSLGRWMLRIAAAVTFIAHGIKAIGLGAAGPDPNFIDLILNSGRGLFGSSTSEATARATLMVIGYLDLVVAALLLLRRWWPIAAWMALWGLLTAASRMTALGLEAWTETAYRLTNGGAPLALAILWWCETCEPAPPQSQGSTDDS